MMTDKPKRIRIARDVCADLVAGQDVNVLEWTRDHSPVVPTAAFPAGLSLLSCEWTHIPDVSAVATPADTADRPKRIRVTVSRSSIVDDGQVCIVERWAGAAPVVRGMALNASCWEPVPDEPAAVPDVSIVETSAASGTVAHSILTEAAGIVQGARNATHGDKERSFGVIAGLWNAYLDGRKAPGPITGQDVAACMVLLKLARSVQGTAARDHFVDAAGYAAIAGELSA